MDSPQQQPPPANGWFDPETGTLLFDQMVAERPSFQKITADGVVTPAELHEQAVRVADLFRTLEAALPPDAKTAATDALCELAVLHALTSRAISAKGGRRS